MSNKNPYGHAADAYGNTAAETDQRALEGKVLLKSARQLEELSKRLGGDEKVPLTDIGDTIEYNRKLWMVFVNDTMNDEHPLPQEIKNNIASLGIFVFKRSNEVLIDTTPEKIQALIDINRNIAAGLMKQRTSAKTEDAAPADPPSEPSEPIIA
ncbi:MAG: flagellar biosynthesis regulator FlaF [Alphaproteobacteria bacterium]|jgi:flagellar protein FlaF